MLQALINHPLSRTLLIFSLICGVMILLAILLQPLLVPIIISFTFYALLEPISEVFERNGMSGNMASLSVLFILLAIVVLGISLLLPSLSSQLTTLQTQLPVVWQSLIDMGENFSHNLSDSLNLDIQDSSLTEPLMQQMNDWGKSALIQVSNIIISLSVLTVLVPVFTFFLIRDYRSFRNYLLDKLPNSSFELGWLIYYRVAHKLQDYIRGIMIQSGIMTVITTLGFYSIGLDAPFLLGLIAGILNLIPYVGPLLAMILPVLLALGHTPVELWLIGAAISVVVIAQLIDNVFVIPAVVASSVNLHPLIVIIGIIVFGNFFGFIGMVLAIPVLSTANIVYSGLKRGIKSRYESAVPVTVQPSV